LPNKQVKKECAAILEGIRVDHLFLLKRLSISNQKFIYFLYYLKQYVEAGNLFEKGESWDRAAQVYIKCKNW
jgi:hypothetical protein